jgi:hypothetical protein
MVVPAPRDYDMLCPLFAWLPYDIIRKTFDVTTQYTCLPHNMVLCKHFKSPNSALNIRCYYEDITTDTIKSNVPTIDGDQKYQNIVETVKSEILI